MSDVNTVWEEYLKEGRALVLKLNSAEFNLAKIREQIATLVLKAHKIGGMSKFVRELQKINPSLKCATILTWTQTKRKKDMLKKVLPEDKKKDKEALATINRILHKPGIISVNSSKKELEEAFNDEHNRSKEERDTENFIRMAQKIQFFICSSVVLKYISVKKLITLHDVLAKVTEKLELHFMQFDSKMKKGTELYSRPEMH